MMNGLPKLMRLCARRVATTQVKPPTLVGLNPRPAPEKKLPKPPRPYNSAWEYWLHQFLLKQSPYWRTQVQLGRPGAPGSTRADFVNNYLRVVLYLDGAYYHREDAGADAFLERGWRSKGYRVVRWRAITFEELVRNAARWYRETIGQFPNEPMRQ